MVKNTAWKRLTFSIEGRETVFETDHFNPLKAVRHLTRLKPPRTGVLIPDDVLFPEDIADINTLSETEQVVKDVIYKHVEKGARVILRSCIMNPTIERSQIDYINSATIPPCDGQTELNL